MKQSKISMSEQKKTTKQDRWARPQTLIVRHRPSETDWGGSHHLVLGRNHYRAIKEGSKALNPNWINNNACSLAYHRVSML